MTQPSTGPEEPAPVVPARLGLVRWVSRIPTPVIFAVAIAVAVVVLWRQGSIDDVRIAMRKADRTSVLTGLALYPAALAVLCVRWHLLVRMVKGVSNAPKAAEAFLTSVVLNYTAPISVASASRAVLTKRALGLSVAETSAVALVEVAADVAVLGIGGLLWFAISGHAADVAGVVPTSALLAAGALLVAVLCGTAAAALFARRRAHLWDRVIQAGQTILISPRRRPREALLALIVTVGYWLAQGTVMWTLLRAVTGESDPTLALGLITVPVLLGMLSGLPGGAGVREALMVAIAKAHGADSAEVLVAAVTYRLALFAAIPILYAAVRIWLNFSRELADSPSITNDASNV